MNNLDKLEDLLNQGEENKRQEQKEKKSIAAKKLGFEDYNQKVRYDSCRRKNNLSTKSKDLDYLEGIEEWKENIDCNRIIYQKGKTYKDYNETLAKRLGFENFNQKTRYDNWRKKE